MQGRGSHVGEWDEGVGTTNEGHQRKGDGGRGGKRVRMSSLVSKAEVTT